MKKTDLKSIIKECLIEILQEGLLTTSYKIQENKNRNPSLIETLKLGSNLNRQITSSLAGL